MRPTLVHPWFVIARHDEPEPAPPVDYRTASTKDFAAELARHGLAPRYEGKSTTPADELPKEPEATPTTDPNPAAAALAKLTSELQQHGLTPRASHILKGDL